MYNANTPYKRNVWKNHEIIGQVTLSLKDKEFLNKIQNEVYFSFTLEEHELIQFATEKELVESEIIEQPKNNCIFE